MWTKHSEAAKVRRLRAAAVSAMAGRLPLAVPVELEFVVHVGPVNHRAVGDLDNFVTGVCDGLQAAPSGIDWASHPAWQGVVPAVAPDRCIVLEDDVLVVKIVAS